ncbi:P-loop containing nucleoside triphosphate hydrolase protein [Podospora appendiculata]|uniref:P-loop containing nucleoside triphosphate hydrolase protein n=1 Tax=Podospora appendiculata TaxID=314037 RepID=A0AAE0X9H9_9PEZI|nr:P-loop containing nucleoside triphosphate hydrolase protein [Podospora appendiculata]
MPADSEKDDASSSHEPRPEAHQAKRRRRHTSASEHEPGDASIDGDGPSSQNLKSAGPKRRKTPAAKATPEPVECLIPWPDWFTALEKTHRALNLVFTFCSTRKHLLTTFDTMRSAVEAHTKRALTVDDVAAVVALRPKGIRFAYVDELMLQIDVKGAEKDDTFQTGGRYRGGSRSSQSFAPDASVGGLTGLEQLGGGPPPPPGREVLYFEFVDEDLKRQVQSRKTGEPTKPTRRLRDEDLKMPVFSQKQMTALIEKRNAKFTQAVRLFLNRCVAERLDPEMTLRSEAEAFVPHPSASRQTLPQAQPRPGPGTLPESIPKERKSIPEIVQELKDSPWYTGQIVPDGHRVFAPQEPVYGDLDFLLSQDVVNALYNAKGITQFYAHQAQAINHLHAGHHVVVATSTSSGKSLIYQLPVLHALEEDRNTRAMYIFPTKALAQDQKRSLREMMGFMPGLEDVLVETYDGDTPMCDRNTIRDEARIIFTNPDMLHVTILPQEERWRSFLKNLRYVVVDELHYYNGLLGSHVAFIMRRLRRICAAVGNRHVRFISCSATVANPEEHFKTIFGLEDVCLVDFDGSPSGRKEFLCWNTPYKDPGDPTSGRGNAMFECARLFCQLILRGVRVIAFCRVRAQCEKLVGAVKHELENLGRPECIARVMGYRGGYTPQDRRKIEAEMFEGKLMGIVATTALELGVDIGTLDCVLTWGFPYTIANLRQQSGRAGRRNKDSLSILVGDGFATDQYYMQNPNELFTKPNCALQVDLDNMLVREGHIQCAAFEMPIRPREDTVYLGADLAKVCAERLVRDTTGFYHCHDRFRPSPSRFVSIRDTEDEHFAVIDITHGRNVVLEELEASRATFTIYDGAIFLHQGNTYLVRDFNPDKRLARVEKVKVDWTTQQRDYTDIDPVETETIKRIPGSRSRAYHGPIKITQVVFGYFKVDRQGRVLDAVHVDNPPVVRYSKGMWLDVPQAALDILVARRLHVAGAIHAAEHAVMSLIPNFVISLPGDVRTECKNSLKEFARRETQRKRPARLTFYDAKGGAGGSGINTKAFEFVDVLLRQALERVAGCCCAAGCVECVCSEMCKEANEVMSKAGSEVILKSLLGEAIEVDQLPMGPEETSPMGVETVVVARPVPGREVGGEGGGDGDDDDV